MLIGVIASYKMTYFFSRFIMSGGGDGLESASLVRHGSSAGRSYMSEGVVQRESVPGHGGSGPGAMTGVTGAGRDNVEASDELDYVESDAPLLSQFHEDAIQQVRSQFSVSGQ